MSAGFQILHIALLFTELFWSYVNSTWGACHKGYRKVKPKADSWTEEKVNEDLFKNLSEEGVNFDFERNPDSDFPEELQSERDRQAVAQGRQADWGGVGGEAEQVWGRGEKKKKKKQFITKTKTLELQESS